MLSAMASTTREGNILLWHVPTQENFAAFAGGFDEIDENTEYMEQEDEFDIEDEDSAARRKEMEEEMEVDVDGITETEMEQRRRALEEDSYHAEMQDMETEWALVGADDDEGDWSLAARE
jgi:COMPASS component SWD1